MYRFWLSLIKINKVPEQFVINLKINKLFK